jgi:hypothetical protein
MIVPDPTTIYMFVKFVLYDERNNDGVGHEPVLNSRKIQKKKI